MEIIWHGGSCFTLKGKKTTAVFDPIEGGDHKLKSVKADTVLLTDDYHEKAKLIKGAEDAYVISWPGEYEVKGAAFIGIPVYTNERVEGDTDKGRIVIFSSLVDDIRICHMGEIGEDLNEDTLEKIGDVDVLFVSVTSKHGMSLKKTIEIIEEIDPRVIIPMNFNDAAELEPLLKQFGVGEYETLASFDIKAKSQLPEEKTDIVVLKAE